MAVGIFTIVVFIWGFVKGLSRAGASGSATKPASSPPSAGQSASLASLARISMRATPKQIAEITGVATTVNPAGSMRIPLAEDVAFTAVRFDWNKEQTHIRLINLEGLRDPSRASVIRGKLRERLRRRFRDSYFMWQGCGIALQGDLLSASAHARWAGGENQMWDNQIETLWDIARADALGLGVQVLPAAITNWLGGGYSLKALGTVDPNVGAEQSYDTLVRLFPGVYTYESAGSARAQFVALDHPWFGEARLGWRNEPGGHLVSISLMPAPGKEQFENEGALNGCLRSKLGQPQVRALGSQLKDHFGDSWSHAGTKVVLSQTEIDISNDAGQSIPRSLLQDVTSALDACGR
ncbi:hypothetical protein LZC95_51125 [Pendulispora brunnea]|uniref:Uncharacterized protein n=1 Tax=Pendulispora brunnea TaxID=2905690 RepID=A0ABZ2KBK1_9BACT